MKNITRIIFAGGSGTSRSPMAKGILEEMPKKSPIEVLSRGLVVQFPEPMNQKAEAVMISNGLTMEEFVSKQLEEEDINEGTMILTMDSNQRLRILEEYEGANEENTFVLSAYVGDELEIIDPYGGPLQSYGLCFEVLRKSIKKLVKILDEMD